MATPFASGDYAIVFDRDAGLLRIAATGFWDRALQDRFDREVTAAMRRTADRGQPFGVLVDATDFSVQSIPISLEFMAIIGRLDADLLVPTAILTKSMLVQLQALRVFVAPHIRVFGDEQAAREWLAAALAGGTGTE